MPIAISEEHRDLAETVHAFTQARDVLGHARTLLDDPSAPADAGPVWRSVAELGWAGLHVSEEHGGGGFALPELAVVFEELGGSAAAGPLFPTAVAAAVIGACGTGRQRAALLPGLADGSTAASFGIAEGISADGDGILSGPTVASVGGVWADLHLIPAGEQAAVVRRPPGSGKAGLGVDPTLGTASWDPTGAAAEALLPGGCAAMQRIVRTLAACEAAGGARACLAMALDYAKQRHQFGRPIGSFQAVKHRLADMLLAAEQASAVAWDAARAATAPDAEASLAAATAASVAVRAYTDNARAAIQVHGGIAFTWEHDAHLYLRRATALSALCRQREAERDVVRLAASGAVRSTAVDLPAEAGPYRAAAAEFRALLDSTPALERRELLVESGYLVPHWPRPWGRGAGPLEQLAIQQELSGAGVPDLGIGGWVLLTLLQTATQEQAQRWLPAGLRGDTVWCQLFSEPGAGSDAAAVQTKGVRVDGGWRVTGQKVWTSGAHRAHRGLATVRTDPEAAKHSGITAMVVDLGAPGVEVRPLRQISGDAEFNEVFFDGVFVPDADVVGEPGRGWTVARATLGNERVALGDRGMRGAAAGAVGTVAWLVQLAESAEDGAAAQEAGRLVAQEAAVRLINLRSVERALSGGAPSAEGALTKLLTAETGRRIMELGAELSRSELLASAGSPTVRGYLASPASTIAGGTSEIARNVIAERILGLPRGTVAN